eukprot:TRINITY_DN1199_c0_g1_i1.p1 TRINITY_DN1199_c0_g1~~TRINITY_DN1199_c0_g1_i1.p1  ORF type:complete len:346 (+),score=80.39 TRINITY_DN1199_c0_g1_i1:253-1290(+)
MISTERMGSYYHVHPEDFGNLTQMSRARAYYFDVKVEKSGYHFVSYSFVYKNGDDLRSGSGSTSFQCRDGVPDDRLTQNFTATSKKFRSYPLNAAQRFDDPIYAWNNTDPAGFTVEMTIGNNTYPGNITAGCQQIRFSVKDEEGNPAINLIPFLNASAHISFVAQYDTLYHGHAMHIPKRYEFWTDVVQMVRDMNMSLESMEGQPNSLMMETMMGAVMIGIDTHTGQLNCISDGAVVMEKMGMDLSEFGFHSPFGNDLVTIFDFPQKGNWRIFVSFAYINITDDSTHLIVADFDARVPLAPTFTNPVPQKPSRSAVSSTSMLMESSGISMQAQWVVSLILLVFML